MNECVVNDNTAKWHYTITLRYQSNEEMNETNLGLLTNIPNYKLLQITQLQ